MVDSGVVSIVTPCLNPGDRLAACLDSVAAQTYPNVEHIVVDGGSTDGTVELLRDRGVRFVSERDRGQTEAINKGFALATGDYLGWLNADDLLVPLAVELAVAAFRANPQAGWVYGDCAMREGEQRWVWRSPRRVGRRTFDVQIAIPQQGVLVARWALDRVGKLDESLHLAMDYDLWLRLVDAGVSAAYVPETLAVFEIHAESKSGSIHRSEFFREEGLALLKSGRRRLAAAAFGRAAAAAAQDAGGRIEPERLRAEVERFSREAASRDIEAGAPLVLAAACAEAAVLELKSTPRGFRHLVRLEPWRYKETRRQLRVAARKGIPFLTRRIARRGARPGGYGSSSADNKRSA